MRVGLISDVHSNLPALRVALARLRHLHADLIINCGDNVGYSPYPDECVELLTTNGLVNVQGNYDAAVAHDRPFCGCGEADPRTLEFWSASLRWTQRKATAITKRFLADLPPVAQMELEGNRLLACHGSPTEQTEFIYPEDTDRMLQLTTEYNADIFIFGHTHQPFAMEVAGRLFVNPGAVGRQLDGNFHMSFAILELTAGSRPKVKFHRASYPRISLRRDFATSGLPPEIARAIIEGNQNFE